ncbi:CDF family Co(II)/Ni(II) efflux transporter DmeF [Xylophilus ampelinus]|uniref:Cation diffusion facilitator family transporter n=1 Tax=Xylophilus ampelinus TaxID=54067 RepID=A0A318SLB3_9BURK|nr:CDF family Co(II)/Ni(II) efflux transporter DmeF [Xylophilus ampelinus]MCS4509070.1 CDF family Co(II)/Ni(II) efflux transporter DmeF [Xylophilus ampelinus]PYE79903.1 cation diffusion facilitator family transporter [Xylophilus ampelinus]
MPVLHAAPTPSAGASCAHAHRFDAVDPLAERNTRRAVWLTAAMMVAEIAGGWIFNSMALLADGWHMGSHAVAQGLSAAAYAAARRLAKDRRFAFGAGKIEVLGGYTSALLLAGVAVLMVLQSVERLLSPLPIHYEQAIGIALVGLVVNLVCARLLHSGSHGYSHGHGHGHGHGEHDHHQHGNDLNLRSAYLHVVADAATSVLAILALAGGWIRGWSWLDPLMGIAGAVLVAVWAWGLLRDTGRVLLDATTDPALVREVREAVALAPEPVTVTDLHVWRVGKGRFACIVALQTAVPVAPEVFRRLIGVHEELVHITVEVNAVGALQPA